MTGYFDLAHKLRDTDDVLQPQDIESGLLVSMNNMETSMDQKQKRISVLLKRFVYSDTDRCTPRATYLALSMLKIFGRQIESGDELTTRPAVNGLLQLASAMHECGQSEMNSSQLKAEYIDASNEALTCVANAMLLEPKCKVFFVESNGFEAVAGILSGVTGSTLTAFLCGRCLFLALISANAASHCVDDLKLQNTLSQALDGYLNVDKSKLSPKGRFTPEQAMDELFKAAMSLTVYFQRSKHDQKQKQPGAASAGISADVTDDSLLPQHAAEFLEVLKVSLNTLATLPLASTGHLSSPSRQAISILLNFPTQSPESVADAWFPPDDKWRYTDCIFNTLTAVLDNATPDAGSVADMADNCQVEVAPLVLVLVRLVAENADVRERVFKAVYPQGADYTQLPEERPGISAKLVKIMKHPQGGMLPGAMGDLLFALWAGDVKSFVMGVGYGNAAGYMLARGIEIPSDVLRQAAGKIDEQLVDPVTGRFLTQDGIDKELATMTDEEKEREAERLFVLFERLNKTGIIKVENPVRAAYQSGRFEEIKDHEGSDSD
ncbi:hypothetical protein GGI12_000092 [Dipsacomyces acuminosporus]|nr:hypothetical protein GGI12_000092 [Dipsacomyces acuminosporus]